jgi:hypothetical protein
MGYEVSPDALRRRHEYLSRRLNRLSRLARADKRLNRTCRQRMTGRL